jgi:hypothetical protein
MEDLEDRVVVLLASLADRVNLEENGRYTVRAQTAAIHHAQQ